MWLLRASSAKCLLLWEGPWQWALLFLQPKSGPCWSDRRIHFLPKKVAAAEFSAGQSFLPHSPHTQASSPGKVWAASSSDSPPQPSFHVTFLYQTPILQVRHPAGCITTLPRSSEVKNPPAMQMQVRSLRWEDSLEKEMATLSTILAWEIPRAEEPGGLQSRGRKRVRHDLATKQQRVIGPTLQPTWPQVGGIHLVCYTWRQMFISSPDVLCTGHAPDRSGLVSPSRWVNSAGRLYLVYSGVWAGGFAFFERWPVGRENVTSIWLAVRRLLWPVSPGEDQENRYRG